jgi:anti-anti-sigma factor
MKRLKTLLAQRQQTLAPVVEAPAARDMAEMRPQGELDRQGLRVLAQACVRHAQGGRTQVALDLSLVDHVDYRGVGALLTARRLLQKASGELALCGASPYLQAILRAAGAYGELPTYPSMHQARQAFAQDRFARP